MKECDKLVCIKDISAYIGDKDINKACNKEMKNAHKFYRENLITESQLKHTLKKCFDRQSKSLAHRVIFTKGKTYTISHVNDSSIDITNDRDVDMNFSILENGRLSVLAKHHYDDHFITMIEARKQKLELLSDKTFNEFLKKIKKV